MHNDEIPEVIPKDILSLVIGNHKFGILEIEVIETVPTTIPQEILFSIDMSGSMGDLCKDNRTKMEHAKNTTKNIVSVLSNLEGAVSMCIHGFNNKVKEFLKWTKIEKEEIANIIEKIEKMKPSESTNIELAIRKAEKSHNKSQIPYSQKTHIFLTDGIANEGESDSEKLAEMIQQSELHNDTKTKQHIFVGFGDDHNSNLLQKMADRSQSGIYYFVDKIERTGLVFGEIVHGIMYKVLEDVEIEIENGEIYDYKTNTWSNKLVVPSLVGEAKKIYHIRTDNTNTTLSSNIKAKVKARVYNTNELVEELIENNLQNKDLIKYMWRQRTQELLCEVNLFSKEKETITQSCFKEGKENHTLENHKLEDNKRRIKNKKIEIRKKLSEFLTSLKNYMTEYKLENDEFYKTIYEDIKTTNNTFDKYNATMYSCARQNSQGRQTTYSPRYEEIESNDEESQYDDIFDISNEDAKVPSTPMKRSKRRFFNHLGFNRFTSNTSDEDILKELTMENVTPVQLKMMREISNISTPSTLFEEVDDESTRDGFCNFVSKRNSPPLPSDEKINITELVPLTEMDELFFQKRSEYYSDYYKKYDTTNTKDAKDIKDTQENNRKKPNHLFLSIP